MIPQDAPYLLPLDLSIDCLLVADYGDSFPPSARDAWATAQRMKVTTRMRPGWLGNSEFMATMWASMLMPVLQRDEDNEPVLKWVVGEQLVPAKSLSEADIRQSYIDAIVLTSRGHKDAVPPDQVHTLLFPEYWQKKGKGKGGGREARQAVVAVVGMAGVLPQRLPVPRHPHPHLLLLPLRPPLRWLMVAATVRAMEIRRKRRGKKQNTQQVREEIVGGVIHGTCGLYLSGCRGFSAIRLGRRLAAISARAS